MTPDLHRADPGAAGQATERRRLDAALLAAERELDRAEGQADRTGCDREVHRLRLIIAELRRKLARLEAPVGLAKLRAALEGKGSGSRIGAERSRGGELAPLGPVREPASSAWRRA